MTISSKISRNNFIGAGNTRVYNFSFKIQKKEHLKVIINDNISQEFELDIDSDYSVISFGSSSGGSIQLNGPDKIWLDENGFLKPDFNILITRNLPLVQETDIRNQGDFYPEVHEDALDYGLMVDQQTDEKINRSIRLPESLDTSNFNPVLGLNSVKTPGSTFIINEEGTGFNVGPTANEISSAQTYAESAESIRDYIQEVADNLASGGGNLNDVTLLGVDPASVEDQSAIIENLLLTRDSLYFPKGVYYLGDIALTDKTVYGLGTIKKPADKERVFLANSNTVIDGLIFDSVTTGVQRSEIKLEDGAENILIKNCRFKGSIYSAISADVNGGDDSLLTYNETAKNIIITSNFFDGYSRHLYLHSVEDLVITNNSFRNSARDSIRFRQSTGMCSVVNNVFKDIGVLDPSIKERPANWVSNGKNYVVGDLVSVPPYGIYECTEDHVSSIATNPFSGGADKFDLINGDYFETKDAIDSFWSGKELIIANNLIDGTGSVGLDIKGSEPGGAYSTNAIIINGNIIKNTFGVGINFHSSALLLSGEFRYIGNSIISNNIIEGCNAERYDVGQAAINLRQGSSNLTVCDNHIKNHFGRGINVLNLDGNSKIQRSLKLSGNQVIDCGIPGHDGNIGINMSPVDGAIVKDNIVENTFFIPEYEIEFSGNRDFSLFLLESSVPNGNISLDTNFIADLDSFITNFMIQMEGKVFLDDPNPLLNIRYYENIEREGNKVTFSSRVPGAFDAYEGSHTSAGITMTIKRNKVFSNSVNKFGLVLREDELVGSTLFSAGAAKIIIKDNIFRKNASEGRYEILYNGREIAAPIAYVTSNNEGNNTLITTEFAATNFTDGADSSVSNHLNSFAIFGFNNIWLRAKEAGAAGNNILISLETLEGVEYADLPLRCTVSLETTISGYRVGGKVIRIIKENDDQGNKIDPTIQEVERVLKTHLNQSIISCRDNILE